MSFYQYKKYQDADSPDVLPGIGKKYAALLANAEIKDISQLRTQLSGLNIKVLSKKTGIPESTLQNVDLLLNGNSKPINIILDKYSSFTQGLLFSIVSILLTAGIVFYLDIGMSIRPSIFLLSIDFIAFLLIIFFLIFIRNIQRYIFKFLLTLGVILILIFSFTLNKYFILKPISEIDKPTIMIFIPQKNDKSLENMALHKGIDSLLRYRPGVQLGKTFYQIRYHEIGVSKSKPLEDTFLVRRAAINKNIKVILLVLPHGSNITIQTIVPVKEIWTDFGASDVKVARAWHEKWHENKKELSKESVVLDSPRIKTIKFGLLELLLSYTPTYSFSDTEETKGKIGGNFHVGMGFSSSNKKQDHPLSIKKYKIFSSESIVLGVLERIFSGLHAYSSVTGSDNEVITLGTKYVDELIALDDELTILNDNTIKTFLKRAVIYKDWDLAEKLVRVLRSRSVNLIDTTIAELAIELREIKYDFHWKELPSYFFANEQPLLSLILELDQSCGIDLLATSAEPLDVDTLDCFLGFFESRWDIIDKNFNPLIIEQLLSAHKKLNKNYIQMELENSNPPPSLICYYMWSSIFTKIGINFSPISFLGTDFQTNILNNLKKILSYDCGEDGDGFVAMVKIFVRVLDDENLRKQLDDLKLGVPIEKELEIFFWDLWNLFDHQQGAKKRFEEIKEIFEKEKNRLRPTHFLPILKKVLQERLDPTALSLVEEGIFLAEDILNKDSNFDLELFLKNNVEVLEKIFIEFTDPDFRALMLIILSGTENKQNIEKFLTIFSEESGNYPLLSFIKIFTLLNIEELDRAEPEASRISQNDPLRLATLAQINISKGNHKVAIQNLVHLSKHAEDLLVAEKILKQAYNLKSSNLSASCASGKNFIITKEEVDFYKSLGSLLKVQPWSGESLTDRINSIIIQNSSSEDSKAYIENKVNDLWDYLNAPTPSNRGANQISSISQETKILIRKLIEKESDVQLSDRCVRHAP